MQRRRYLEGLAAAAGIVTVSPTGKATEHKEGDNHGPSPCPPAKGDSVMGLTVDPIQPVRVGVIGLGNRGSFMTELIDAMYPDKGEINAICDLVEDRVEETLSELQDGQNPDTYSAGVSEDSWDGEDAWKEDDIDKMNDSGWKEMVQRDDLDLIFIFTHHRAHAPMAKYAMEQGKHVASEVPAATTIKECWELVDTAEKTQKHYTMLENVNYFEEQMWVLNMIRNGVFGELSHAYGAYIDYQVGSFLHDYGPPVNWRGRMHYEEKGDLYPTHGLGPIAWYMDILRGDRFEYIASEESPATRFPEYVENELDEDHEFYGKTDWKNGDTTRSLIKTNRDLLIEEQLDEATNRPYSLGNQVAGEEAFHDGSPSQLTVNEEGEGAVDDETYDEYWEQHRHPLWSEEMKELAEEHGGHGGGDFLEIYRLFDALNNGRPLDIDVYDAVTWSAVRPLSQISIEHGGKPVKFPDFTRGRWDEERELEVMKFETIN